MADSLGQYRQNTSSENRKVNPTILGQSQLRERNKGIRKLNTNITCEAVVQVLHGGDGGGLVALLCPTLCDPMDCSLPGFSVHRILLARTLEWVAISISSKFSIPEGIREKGKGQHKWYVSSWNSPRAMRD